MIYHPIFAATAIGFSVFAGSAAAQGSAGNTSGEAIIAVATQPPGAAGTFVFTGVPQGTASAGAAISKTGLAPGAYTSVATETAPDFVLVGITCNDGGSASPSQGNVQARTAVFNIDPGETVTCVFLHRSSKITGDSGGPAAPGEPGGSVPGGAPEPAGPAGPGSLTGPNGCMPPDLVPKAGRWNVSNFPGRMVCGNMINMPLTPSQETGTLEISDCGWTVVGTGMAEDTAQLTMRAVDQSSGRYTGTVGGAQDGIPMTIEFSWKLNSDEWIVGELKSRVTQQGMTCNMSRPFELRYSSP